MAPAVMKTLTSILDQVPIAYVLRIDTSDGQVYEQSGPRADALPRTTPRARPFES